MWICSAHRTIWNERKIRNETERQKHRGKKSTHSSERCLWSGTTTMCWCAAFVCIVHKHHDQPWLCRLLNSSTRTDTSKHVSLCRSKFLILFHTTHMRTNTGVCLKAKRGMEYICLYTHRAAYYRTKIDIFCFSSTTIRPKPSTLEEEEEAEEGKIFALLLLGRVNVKENSVFA